MFIFEKPPTPGCHASTIVELDKTNLMAAWFAGKDEGAKDVQIWHARFDGTTWSKPEVLATEPGQPCWNPVLFRTAKGKLLLWYKAGPTPQTWTGYLRTSADDGKTWSKPAMLPAGFYGPVRAKPIQLKNGTILAGTSVETYRNWTPYVDRSTDDGVTWTRSSPFPTKDSFAQIQPTLYTRGDKQDIVVALMRSKDPLKICEASSTDSGVTFGPAVPTTLFNPSSGIDVVQTGDKELFLIYNPTGMARTPISLARSTDGGLTWKKIQDLETATGEYSYPAMIASSRGTLEITYTWNRTHIMHHSLELEKLRGTKP